MMFTNEKLKDVFRTKLSGENEHYKWDWQWDWSWKSQGEILSTYANTHAHLWTDGDLEKIKIMALSGLEKLKDIIVEWRATPEDFVDFCIIKIKGE